MAGPGVLRELSCFGGRRGPGNSRASRPQAEGLPCAWHSPSPGTWVTHNPEEDWSLSPRPTGDRQASRTSRASPGAGGRAAAAEVGGWWCASSPGWHTVSRPWGHWATLRRKRGLKVSCGTEAPDDRRRTCLPSGQFVPTCPPATSLSFPQRRTRHPRAAPAQGPFSELRAASGRCSRPQRVPLSPGKDKGAPSLPVASSGTLPADPLTAGSGGGDPPFFEPPLQTLRKSSPEGGPSSPRCLRMTSLVSPLHVLPGPRS